MPHTDTEPQHDAITDTPHQSDLSTPLAYRPIEWIWMLGCVIVGGACRLINLAGRPLWVDELTTLITVRRPLGESFTTGQDPQPPLHQLLVRMLAGGDASPSEVILRAPACAFGIASIAAAWWCARHFASRGGAAVVALLVALNPLLIHHSRDARPYSLYVFFAILSITFFYRLIRRGGATNVIGYALSTTGIFLSHYYAMFFLAGAIAFAVIDFLLGGSTRKHCKAVVAGFVLTLVGAAPILYLFYQLITGGMKGSWWISPPHGVIHGFDALGDLLGLRALGVLCIIPLVAAIWWQGKLTVKRGDWTRWWIGKERAIYLASIVGFALFLPLIGSILVKPGWVERYSLPVAIPMLILGVMFLRANGPVVTVMVLLVVLGATSPKGASRMKGEPGLRDVVTTVNKNYKNGDVVMLPNWPFAEDYINPDSVGIKYYGLDETPSSTLVMPMIDDMNAYVYGKSNKVPADRIKFLRDNPDTILPKQRTWAICFHSTAKAVKGFLTKRGRTYSQWTFGMYDDGKTPMYTLIRIDARRE